jgi:hypothetical protein
MAVVAVQQPNSNMYKDPLEQIGKALGIAQSIYGIKTAYEQGKLRELQMQREEQAIAGNKIGLEQKQKEATREDESYALRREGAMLETEFDKDYYSTDDSEVQRFNRDFGKDVFLPKVKVKIVDPKTGESRDVTAYNKSAFEKAVDQINAMKSRAVIQASSDAKAETALNKAEEKINESNVKSERERSVPGVGVAYTVQDAKDLKEAMQTKKDIDSLNDQMIALRKKYGPETLNREAVAKGRSLSKQALLKYKTLSKLGVLSEADMTIVNQIIPEDPLGYSASDVTLGLLPGGDPIMAQLEQLRETTNSMYENSVNARLLKAEPVDPELQAAENILKEYNAKNAKK